MKKTLKELQKLTTGLFYMSESDFPIEVVDTTIPDHADAIMIEIMESQDEMEEILLQDFFRHTARWMASEDPTEVEMGINTQKLVDYLLELCGENIHVCKLGTQPQKRVYIIGKNAHMQFVILQTQVVET